MVFTLLSMHREAGKRGDVELMSAVSFGTLHQEDSGGAGAVRSPGGGGTSGGGGEGAGGGGNTQERDIEIRR